MPVYTVTIEAGSLTQADKTDLALKLTKLHSDFAGVPPEWVHVVFIDIAPGGSFTAGKPNTVATLTLLIRSGRSADYKRSLLSRLWPILQTATGLGDDALIIGIQEVPPSQAMEMGKIMPNVDDHCGDLGSRCLPEFPEPA